MMCYCAIKIKQKLQSENVNEISFVVKIHHFISMRGYIRSNLLNCLAAYLMAKHTRLYVLHLLVIWRAQRLFPIRQASIPTAPIQINDMRRTHFYRFLIIQFSAIKLPMGQFAISETKLTLFGSSLRDRFIGGEIESGRVLDIGSYILWKLSLLFCYQHLEYFIVDDLLLLCLPCSLNGATFSVQSRQIASKICRLAS